MVCDSIPFVDPRSRFCNLPVVKAIDPEIARQLAAELPHDVFVGVVRTFEADLARLVQQMLAALTAGDMEAYRRNAHSLAGAAGAIGARQLEAMARKAMNQDATAASGTVPALGIEAKAALTELMALSSTTPPRA